MKPRIWWSKGQNVWVLSIDNQHWWFSYWDSAVNYTSYRLKRDRIERILSAG